jgi:arylsulfatase A-like enzyme
MARQSQTDGRPNIVLIGTDQQRFDALGINGNGILKTPTLDGLAGRGVNFTRAFAQNTVCVPSRACIHTGRYTHQHGCRYMEVAVDDTPGLPPWEKTFMEHLQGAGYVTGACGKIHMYPEKGYDWHRLTGGKGGRWTQSTGLPIGPGPLGPVYAEWLEERHPGGYELIYEQRRRPEYKANCKALVNVLPLEEYVEWWTKENAIEFITSNKDRPFFLWCGSCGPHEPFDPPEPYASLYNPDDMPVSPICLAPTDGKPAPYHSDGLRHERGLEIVKLITARYYALMTLIDDMTAQIVDALRLLDLLDNTLIVHFSDHGEMLGDFGLTGKRVFHEHVLRVPMFIVPPGQGGSGNACDEMVETMDLAPTILDYAGVDIPDTVQAASLRPIIENRRHEPKQHILSEWTDSSQTTHGKCVRTDRYKYVCWSNDIGEFYDMREDPFEQRNLWSDPAYAELVREHERLLLKTLLDSEKPIIDR